MVNWLWLTGLSGSGKTTIAQMVWKEIEKQLWISPVLLDWDLLRTAFSKPLWFSREDRQKNIETAALIASILSHRDIPVIGSFISPYKEDRERVRNCVKNYVEVYLDTPIEICEARDTKWLYQKARLWEIQNFTGISDPYEIPKNPDLSINTSVVPINKCAMKIITLIKDKYWRG